MRPQTVLIVKTSSLGDLVHTLPAITDMTRRFPTLVVDWVAEEAFADIPRLHPKVRRVIVVALRRWRRTPWRRAVWREWSAFRSTLGSVAYDQILDHQGLIKSAVLAYLAQGQRYGFDPGSAREPWAAFCYHQRYAVEPRQHAVVRNRALAALALGYDIPTDPPNYGIRTHVHTVGWEPLERYAVCLHATSRASKTWPKEHWIALGKALANTGWSCLLPWGNDAERQTALDLARGMPLAQVLPKLAVREMAGVLSGAGLVVGVDTGLTHLAAALGCPTVAIYTDTSPDFTGVVANEGGWAINLGGAGQMPTPDQVIAALQPILRGSPSDIRKNIVQ